MTQKKDIRELDREAVKDWFVSNGEKAFRAKQLNEWLFQKGARSFEEMSNLSLDLRQKLKENFTFLSLETDLVQTSNDGTVKSRFKLHDGNLVEGVLIPTKSRMTACISSQVGCSLACSFCATGKMKRVRNLNPLEIFDQVNVINEQAKANHGMNLTNIVYMGMGEPLLNYKNTLDSIELITSPTGLHMSPRRITVSTAGIAKIITKMADEKVKFNLALSLHAANDTKRDKIMPINEQNNLKALSEALKYLYEQTGRWLYIEYILFDKFNDTEEDAIELSTFTRQFPCKVNILDYNPVEGTGLKKTTEEKREAFEKVLLSKNVRVSFRKSRGKDIDAACGQLANK